MRRLNPAVLIGLIAAFCLGCSAFAQDGGAADAGPPAADAGPPSADAAPPAADAGPASTGAAAPAADTDPAEDDGALSFDEPVDVPPPKELPPMPAANADFTGDLDAFGTKVITEPEAFRKAQQEAAARRARSSLPLYQQSPWMASGAEAAAGVFGAGMLGLVGGAIGEALDSGERNQPLGGAGGGRLYGVLTGGFIGSSVGVWGAAALFDKDVAPGWTILGAGLGSVVGGGAAAGMLLGIDDRNTAGTLAVGTVFLSQVIGAMLFTHIGTVDPVPPPAPDFKEPRIR